MPTRNVLLAVALLIASVYLARHQISVLYELQHQYWAFPLYIKNNPNILFRYPDEPGHIDPGLKNAFKPEAVPKIIHQIYLTKGNANASISKYEPAMQSCKTLHPDWEHKLWNDTSASQFMSEHYPTLAPHFEAYPQNIQRANILRYALLHHFGGVFFDLDITCHASLETPLVSGVPGTSLSHLPFLTPGASPAGVNNAFIIAQPGHRFLEHLLERAPERDLWWPLPYVGNMFSTGCEFFSDAWLSYQAGQERKRRKGHGVGDETYILADERGNMEPHMLRGKVVTPILEHGGESSWHRWDKKGIFMLEFAFVKHPVTGFGVLSGIFLGIGFVMVRSGRGHRRRRSWNLGRSSIDKSGQMGLLEEARS